MLAVTTDRNNGRSVRVETAIAAHVPRNHTLVMFACGSSADAAIAKVEDKPQLTRIVAAWKYIDGVLAPVGNLRKVRCTNEGYGVLSCGPAGPARLRPRRAGSATCP
ncbi:MAG: hypothetical protein U1F49_13135 [Rubrivivax sp.]